MHLKRCTHSKESNPWRNVLKNRKPT